MMENYDTDCVGNLTSSVVKELAKDLDLYMAATTMSGIWQRIIIIGGLLGNILIVIVMMQSSNRWNSCSNYIAVLAVSDSVALLRKSMDHLYPLFSTKYTNVSCSGWVYVALTACQFSMLLVMCMTVDRMIAVKFPNRLSIYCSVGRARKVMLFLLIVALLFNIPHLFLTSPISDGKYCAAFARIHTWSLAYGWLQVIVNFIIPLISLTTMTIIIIKILGSNRRKTDEARKRRSSNASRNFVVFINGDGLFHYVLAFIVNGFKDLEKQISTSSINISRSKNQNTTKTDQEGNINEAYTDEQLNSNNTDGLSNDNKPSSEGRSMADADSLAQNDLVISARKLSQHTVDIPHSQPREVNPGNENDVYQTQNTLDPIPLNDPEAPERDVSNTSVGDPQEEGSGAVQRQTSKESRNQLNVVLFLVVFFFVLLTAPQHIRYILYNLNFVNRWLCPKAYATYVMIYHISNKAYFTNCAINFYLYFCGSSMFRNSIKEIFTCCCRRREQRVEEEEQQQEQQGVPTVSEQCDIQLTNVISEGAHAPTATIVLGQPTHAQV